VSRLSAGPYLVELHPDEKLLPDNGKRRPVPVWVGGVSACEMRYLRRLPRLGASLALTKKGRPIAATPASPHGSCRCGSEEACHHMSVS
jgi:hypothetical protein